MIAHSAVFELAVVRIQLEEARSLNGKERRLLIYFEQRSCKNVEYGVGDASFVERALEWQERTSEAKARL